MNCTHTVVKLRLHNIMYTYNSRPIAVRTDMNTKSYFMLTEYRVYTRMVRTVASSRNTNVIYH